MYKSVCMLVGPYIHKLVSLLVHMLVNPYVSRAIQYINLSIHQSVHTPVSLYAEFWYGDGGFCTFRKIVKTMWILVYRADFGKLCRFWQSVWILLNCAHVVFDKTCRFRQFVQILAKLVDFCKTLWVLTIHANFCTFRKVVKTKIVWILANRADFGKSCCFWLCGFWQIVQIFQKPRNFSKTQRILTNCAIFDKTCWFWQFVQICTNHVDFWITLWILTIHEDFGKLCRLLQNVWILANCRFFKTHQI